MGKLNSFLRWIFVIFGGLFLLLDLLPKEKAAVTMRKITKKITRGDI